MANKPLKSVQFPGLDGTYTIPQVDTTLAVTGAAADSKKVGDEITNLKADFTDMDGKIAATMITNTASGSIASFPDGADGVPVKDLVVDIEPVQDLHGQANPYPAGSGKNLLLCDASKELKANGNPTRSYQNGQVTIEASVVAAYYVILDVSEIVDSMVGNTYVVSSDRGSGSSVGVFDPSNNSFDADPTNTRTITSSDVGKRLAARFYNATGTNVTWKQCQVELGSTATAYAPYENICPISGWTGANVARTGKNLVKTKDPSRTNAGVTYTVNDDGSVKAEGTTTATSWFRSGQGNATFLKQGTYKLTGGVSNNKMLYLVGTYADGSSINNSTVTGGVYDMGNGLTFTLLKDAYITYQIQINNGQVANDVFYPMIRVASDTDDTFVPCVGNTYSITFQTEAGTVYGVTLDVTNGVLTVNRAHMKVGNNFSYTGGNVFAYSTSLPKQPATNSTIADIISSAFPSVSQVNLANGYGIAVPATTDYIRINAPGYTTDQAFAEAFSDVDIVFALKTPVTYQLTPQEVSTLLGLNNIWADCGDTTVDYRADTKLYIEKLTAPSEDDMVANTNIPDATYFMVGNTLYLSTTTIPAGDTINPGTNCTKMDLAAALNAINA